MSIATKANRLRLLNEQEIPLEEPEALTAALSEYQPKQVETFQSSLSDDLQRQKRINAEILSFTNQALKVVANEVMTSALALIGLGGGIVLAYTVAQAPSAQQIGLLVAYSVFVVGLLWTRKK